MWPSSDKERRPEPEILALCTQSDWRQNIPRIKEIAPRISDWRELAELAKQNRVSSLVAPVFEALNQDGIVPEAAMGKLREDSFQATATALHFQKELEDFLGTLAEHELPVIVLKGLALSHLLYSEPHRRPCGDIDILVHEEDYSRLHKVLVDAGYVAQDSNELPYYRSELETVFEQHFLAPGGGVQIEVHTDSIKLGVKPAGAEAVWERAVSVQIGAKTALSLSHRDLALMLPIHLHRHGFIRLLWFKDIDLLIREHSDKFDWDLVIEDARKEGATPSLYLTLKYLRMLLDTPVPDEVMRQVRPGLISRMAWRMLWPDNRVVDLNGITRRRMVQFAIDESWRGTIPSLFLMGRRWEKMKILFSRLTRRKKRPHASAPTGRVSP